MKHEGKMKTYEQDIQVIFKALKEMLNTPNPQGKE